MSPRVQNQQILLYIYYNCCTIAGALIKVIPVKSDADVCVGDSVTLEAEIVTDQERLDILWFHGNKSIPENDEHFTMTTNMNKTVLDIHNTLPSHDSKYNVKVYKSENHDYYDVNTFGVEVHGKIIFTEYCIIHEFISAYVNVPYITKVLLSFLFISLPRLSLCYVMQ